MRYRFRQNTSKMATLVATFPVGSRVEYNTNYPHGIAHFMEHFRFQGTEKYSARDLTTKVAYYGGSWNAYTSEDLVAYYITLPEDNLEQGFELLSQVVLHPTFPEQELEREKGVVCQEVRMYEDDISDLVYNNLVGRAFDNAKARNIVGTEDTVNSITRDHLVDFDNEFYTRDNMLVSLVARNDYSDLVEKYFGTIDDKLYVPVVKDFNLLASSFRDTTHKDGLIQETVYVSYGVRTSSPEDRVVGRVCNSILGANNDSRLFMNLREDKGLVYGVYSGIHNTFDGGLYSIVTETDPEHTEVVIAEIDKEVERMKTDLPTDEELTRAKNRIRSAEYSREESSQALSHMPTSEEFYGYYYGDKYLDDIFAVTAEEVRDYARRMFSNNKYVVIGTSKEKENER